MLLIGRGTCIRLRIVSHHAKQATTGTRSANPCTPGAAGPLSRRVCCRSGARQGLLRRSGTRRAQRSGVESYQDSRRARRRGWSTLSQCGRASSSGRGEPMKNGDKLRDGIFALRTRRFGSVAECMIKRMLQCSQAKSLFHDLYDDNLKHRIEVKFSVVQKACETTVTEETVLR